MSATKLNTTPASVMAKIAHSPSACASAFRAMRASLPSAKIAAAMPRNVTAPASHATTERTADAKLDGSNA